MNDSNRQSLPTSYSSGPPPPLHHTFSGSTAVDSWMTTAPSAGQPLPSYGTLANQNDFDGLRQGYNSGLSSPGPGGNGPPNFIHHSYIQQPYLNNKYGSTPDYSQTHFSSNLYNSPIYANNYVSKVDISSKQNLNNSDSGTDTHMEDMEGNTAEGLTARLLDKNSDNSVQPGSPSSQDGSGSNGVGYRPWEQPGAEGQQLAQDQANAQSIQHPNRPSSAQSDKQQAQQQRTTPDTARRTGRSPSAQQFGDNQHPIERLSNQTTEKYQTLTPVPPIPPISAPGYNPNIYGQPPPVVYPNSLGASPYMQSFAGSFSTPDGKQLKMGITEPDSSTPDVRIGAIENSFQVPSVSSTTSRPTIGGIPQQLATPPHPQTAQQVVAVHHAPQTINEQWEASNQVSVPQNISQQTPVDGEKVTKKKRKRCGECPGCLKKDNCGECGPCKSVRSHQICKMRKCDQLKTKKEKVREAAQLAAAAAASGMTLTKDISVLDGSSVGSRNINGTPAITTPFTNLGPTDSHTAGVGPAPRGSYQDFVASKHPTNMNQVFESNPQTYANFHMNSQPMSGPYNGHGLVADVNRSHHTPEDGVNPDNTHANRHQMMNNRLKSLIQSRQNQKEINSGQNHNTFPSGASQPPSFAGQTFIVVQPPSNANNTSLSPHYVNTSGVTPNSETGQSFLQINWSQAEQDDNIYHKNTNGISEKVVGIQGGGRRTPYNNSIDMQNGLPYHPYYGRDTPENGNNSQFSNANDAQTNSNNNNNNNNSTNSQFQSNTYSTNQSQSYTSPPNQEYSSHESNASSPASQSRSQTQDSNTFRPNSRSSPARVNVSSGNSVTKTIDSERVVAITGNGVNTSQSGLHNDESLESQSFLSNTTTTMHHNLSDLTTSMNTSTGIINSFNMSPHSQSSAFYTSSIYMPHIGLSLGPSSPTVIMSVSGTGLETAKKSLEESQTSVGHIISGIDCGRIIDQIDSNTALNLMEMTAYTKSEPTSSSSLTSSLMLSSSQSQSSESQHNLTSISSAATTTTTTTVLPPVSTFLLPNFRDQNWWDRNLDRLKNNTKDANDCDCYATEEREYNRSASPSSLTTLPASLSN